MSTPIYLSDWIGLGITSRIGACLGVIENNSLALMFDIRKVILQPIYKILTTGFY